MRKNKIYIAGNFTTYNGQQQKYIARLNMNGSLDTSFNIQLNAAAHNFKIYRIMRNIKTYNNNIPFYKGLF